MDYEKKYKEALEWARKVMQGKIGFVLDDVLEKFPELKESEDERIRKWLIHYFKEVCDNVSEKEKKGIVAWLEKQPKDSPVHSNSTNIGKVEQKPDDKVEPKFKVGDVIKPKDGGHEPWKIMQVDILDKKYRFKDGYVIHFSQEDAYELVEQKHAWSDEDEKMLNVIIKDLVRPWNEYIPDRIEYEIKWLKNRLKSLKERYTWKPSDEQMDALNYVVNLMASSERPTENDLYYNILKSLKEQLKRLREE